MSPVEVPLHKDIVCGAKGIAKELFGDEKCDRKVFHLAATGRLPVFRIGSRLCIRRSELLSWIKEMETNSKKGRPLAALLR